MESLLLSLSSPFHIPYFHDFFPCPIHILTQNNPYLINIIPSSSHHVHLLFVFVEVVMPSESIEEEVRWGLFTLLFDVD